MPLTSRDLPALHVTLRAIMDALPMRATTVEVGVGCGHRAYTNAFALQATVHRPSSEHKKIVATTRAVVKAKLVTSVE